jgi:O-antigen/teichoic acid export membrane protein/O-antigen ligase
MFRPLSSRPTHRAHNAAPLLTFQKTSPRRAVSRITQRWRPAVPGLRPSTIAGTVAARIGAALLSFGAGVITARSLGPHGRAMLALAIAVPAIFAVLGVLGLDNANARFAGRSHSAFRQAVGRSVVFSVTGGTALAAAWLLAGRHWPAVRLGLDPRLALLSALLCPVSLLVTLLGTAEIGRGRVTVYNQVTIGAVVVYVAGVFVLLATGHLTVTTSFLACAAGQVLAAAALLLLASARTQPDGERVSLRRYGGYACRAYLPNVAQYGMLRMDVPIIGLLAGTSAVALYAVALPVAEGVMLLPTAVALVMFPGVTSGAVGRAEASRIGQAVVAATALLAGAVALAAPVAIPAVYGGPYRGAVTVVWCMLPGLVCFSVGRTPQAYLAATDRLNRVILATATGIAAGLVGLLVLGPRFGAAGAGAADSLGYLGFMCAILATRRHGAAAAAVAGCRGGLRRACAPVVTRWDTRLLVVYATGCAAGLATALVVTSRVSVMVAVLDALVVLAAVTLPGAGLAALAVACPLSQTDYGAQIISSKDLIVLLASSVIGQAVAGALMRPRGRVAVPAIVAVCYFLLSVTLAGAASGSWRYVLMLGIPLLLMPLIAGPGAATRRAVIVFGLSSAVLAVGEVFRSHASLVATGDTSTASSAQLAAGQTGAVNHNAEAAIFVLALAVLLAWLPRARRPAAKLAAAVAIAALALGIAYSFSRSGYLAALAVIVLFAARRSVRGLVGAAVAVGCLVPVLPVAVSARLGSVWNSSGLDPSSALRLDLWSSALRMFEAHPVFGVGYLNFSSQLPAYYINTGSYDSFVIQFSLLDFAHNTYLTILAETGLAGVALLGVLVAVGWRRAWSAARAGDWAGEAALLGFVGIAVCGFFGEVLLVPPILTAFLLVLLAAGDRRAAA